MMKGFSKFILTRILGWKITHNFPLELKKYVAIAAPHTSWVDFPIAVLFRTATGVKINFIGKSALFKPPFGFLFRWLGGAPVDRSKSNNSVDEIVKIFNSKNEFRLGLSPEGTRKKVGKWKTGFYYIAQKANIPIVMVTLNFGEKELKISTPYYTTKNMAKDFEVFEDFYKNIKGKNPKLS